MRSVLEQQSAALAKARGITVEEARAQIVAAKTLTVTVKPSKGH